MRITPTTQIGMKIGTAVAIVIFIVGAVWAVAEAEDRIDTTEQAVRSLAVIEEGQAENLEELKGAVRGLTAINEQLIKLIEGQDGRIRFLEEREMDGQE